MHRIVLDNNDGIIGEARMTEQEFLGKALEAERKRHEAEMDFLLTRCSELKIYVPGANPFKYPGCFKDTFRAATE
jgi:hypothetical protein